jgi:SAM-dependent methyltransferase
MLVDNECTATKVALKTLRREIPPPPLGSCSIPIVNSYLENIKKDMRVLEIGCGSWSIVKDKCIEAGAEYQCVDITMEYYGKKTVATRVENLRNLSFNDEYFDIVIGNQTMEHWKENGCSLKRGLGQCFRVLKLNGKLLLNVPIHFHGSSEFILGNLNKLRNSISKYSNEIIFEKWGDSPEPLKEFYPFPSYWKLQKKPSYVLDIHSKKSAKSKSICFDFWPNGFIARILAKPLSYLLYKLLCKLSFIKDDYNKLTINDKNFGK